MNEQSRRAPPADFTEIDGVGPKTAEALNRAGIDSMATLASMTVDEVVQALAAVGVPASANKIVANQWLQQAWHRSRPISSNEPEEAVEEAVHSNGEDRSLNEWVEYAGYFIYFDRTERDGEEQWRTRVWDTRAMEEQDMPGTAPGPWVSYILARTNLPKVAADPSPSAFEVNTARFEQRVGSSGPETWITAEIAVKIQQDAAFETALGAALLATVLPPESPHGRSP